MIEYLIVAVVATVVGFAVATAKKAVVRHRSDSWNSARGTVEHGELHYEQRGKVSVPVAQLSYSFQYEGEYYAGFFRKNFMREEAAYKLIDAVPSGTPVTIRFKPGKPDQSVLREDDNAAVFAVLGVVY